MIMQNKIENREAFNYIKKSLSVVLIFILLFFCLAISFKGILNKTAYADEKDFFNEDDGINSLINASKKYLEDNWVDKCVYLDVVVDPNYYRRSFYYQEPDTAYCLAIYESYDFGVTPNLNFALIIINTKDDTYHIPTYHAIPLEGSLTHDVASKPGGIILYKGMLSHVLGVLVMRLLLEEKNLIEVINNDINLTTKTPIGDTKYIEGLINKLPKMLNEKILRISINMESKQFINRLSPLSSCALAISLHAITSDVESVQITRLCLKTTDWLYGLVKKCEFSKSDNQGTKIIDSVWGDCESSGQRLADSVIKPELEKYKTDINLRQGIFKQVIFNDGYNLLVPGFPD